jgi:hypothetical protein
LGKGVGGRGMLDEPREAPARPVYICRVNNRKRSRADGPSAGTSYIKRRRQTIESFPVFKRNLALAAKPSFPKSPVPKGGCRQIIKVILKNNKQEYLVRELLDFGASIPLLNKSQAQNYKIPISRRAKPRLVENFAGKIKPEIGLAYTYPLRLQHRKQLLVESFEIGPTDDECNAILLFW